MDTTIAPDFQPLSFKDLAPSESQIVAACIRWLYQNGVEPIRNNTGGFSKTYTDKRGVSKTHHVKVGKKGSGDILFCNKSGQWVEIECKKPGKNQEDHQIERQKHIEKMGGIYLVIRGLDDMEAHKREILG